MKSIITLLSVAFIASVGFTGCSTQGAKTNCPMNKKDCPQSTSCCTTTAAACPMKKTSSQ